MDETGGRATATSELEVGITVSRRLGLPDVAGEPVIVDLPFIDLRAQRRRLGDRLDRAIVGVLDHAAFVMGPEVGQLEQALAAYCGAQHVVTCANGTDALLLALMAQGIGRGDAVFLPSFTFAATAEAVVRAGATPVFVDAIEATCTIDPASLDAAAADVRNLRPAAVIPVDLFGRPADYPSITAIADSLGLTVIADAAQSFGATRAGRAVGTLGKITATSFYPSKPLGCYGDGGAMLTDDEAVAARLRSLRMHGQGTTRGEHVRVGLNSRLDTMQAAILLVKLSVFPEEIVSRERVAGRYDDGLRNLVDVPPMVGNGQCVWAQYTIQVDDRDAVAARLKRLGVPTGVYYGVPLHRQPPYLHFPRAPGGLTVTERLASRVLSLPMHPYLTDDVQQRIIAAVRDAVR